MTMYMQRSGRLALIILSALLSACASTRFSSEAPTTPGWPGEKLLVMVSATDTNLRMTTENQAVADIAPANHASPAHRQGIDGQPTEAAVRARISRDGFDRILLLRIAGVEKRLVRYPAIPYGYGDPWMWGWPPGWRPSPFWHAPLTPFDATPPRIVEALAVSVESQLINASDGTILWRALSHTLTEGTTAQALEDIARTVTGTLARRNWLLSE